MQETLFISDLHLDTERPVITGLFLRFLKERATQASALYILGDLFEVWLGDDDDSHFSKDIILGLRQLANRNVPVYVMHGNRDFLMGSDFETNTGCSLISDPCVIDLYGKPTLLMHGDTLCTDDVEYITFREMVRSPKWQQEFLARSIEERRQIADGLRETSKEKTSHKPEHIMDANQGAIEAVMREQGVAQLIHGHTHRPAVHAFNSGQQSCTRYVLGDWYKQGSVLSCTESGCTLETLS